jgi:signal transduction histidine kinase
MTEAAKEMQAGDLSVRVRAETQDEIGLLAESLNTMADAVTSRIKIQRGNGQITETMATADGLRDAVENLGKQLVDLTGSDLGACYVFNEDNNRFDNLGAIEISSELLERFETDNREGRLGEILSTRDISVVRDVTRDAIFTFKTSTGTVLPREIITVPLIAESRVSAIIVLASLHAYSPESVEILDQSRAAVNAVTSNLVASDRMRRLAETQNIKNQELQSRVEELQVQSKKLQAELQGQRECLEWTRPLESELLPNMSYELRTLLNSVLALSHVLTVQAGKGLSEKEHSYLEIIDRGGKRLLSFINDILDISGIEAGKIPASAEVFSLDSTIGEIAKRMSVMAEDKGIVIEHDIPDESPLSSAQDGAADGDPVSSVQEDCGQLIDMDPGTCPAEISTSQDGTTGWGVLIRKIRYLITDGVRLCWHRDPSKGRHTRRVERIEKRLRKFIETD